MKGIGILRATPIRIPNHQFIVGFLGGGGNWGTLRIPREDWGTLGNIREPPPLGPPPLNNPINLPLVDHYQTLVTPKIINPEIFGG